MFVLFGWFLVRRLYDQISWSGWRFGTFFVFPYIEDNPSHWLIFFKMVKTTNQWGVSQFIRGILVWTNWFFMAQVRLPLMKSPIENLWVLLFPVPSNFLLKRKHRTSNLLHRNALKIFHENLNHNMKKSASNGCGKTSESHGLIPRHFSATSLDVYTWWYDLEVSKKNMGTPKWSISYYIKNHDRIGILNTLLI